MKKTLDDDLREVIRLIQIEKKLGKEKITQEEVDFARYLADTKKYPRAEYVVAVMYLNGKELPKNKDTAIEYLDRSSEHASYDIQIKIAYVYHVLDETTKLKKCLRLAIEDLELFYPPIPIIRKNKPTPHPPHPKYVEPNF